MACKQVKASLSPVIQFKSCSFSARNFAISAMASCNAAGSGGMTSGDTSGTSETTGKRLGSTAAELVSGAHKASAAAADRDKIKFLGNGRENALKTVRFTDS